MPSSPTRLIALGASNLTRGLFTLVTTAESLSTGPVEVLSALGHGRSYGLRSRVLVRDLPGILDSGLWGRIASLPEAPTRAIVTDVGNDLLYGASVSVILDWVRECLARLSRHGCRVVLTDLPLFNIRRLTPPRFLFFRSVLFPPCRLSLGEVASRAEALNDGIVSLAEGAGHALVRLRPEWYGFDPIHIQARHWALAWREILLGGDSAVSLSPGSSSRSATDGLRLYLARPEKQWVFGRELKRSQPAARTRRGTTISLY